MNKHIEEVVRKFREKIEEICKLDFLSEKTMGDGDTVYPSGFIRSVAPIIEDWLRTILLTYAAKEREELRNKTNKLHRNYAEDVDDVDLVDGYNDALDDFLSLLSLLTPEPTTSPKEKV